jgi:hypothetical protein
MLCKASSIEKHSMATAKVNAHPEVAVGEVPTDPVTDPVIESTAAAGFAESAADAVESAAAAAANATAIAVPAEHCYTSFYRSCTRANRKRNEKPFLTVLDEVGKSSHLIYRYSNEMLASMLIFGLPYHTSK